MKNLHLGKMAAVASVMLTLVACGSSSPAVAPVLMAAPGIVPNQLSPQELVQADLFSLKGDQMALENVGLKFKEEPRDREGPRTMSFDQEYLRKFSAENGSITKREWVAPLQAFISDGNVILARWSDRSPREIQLLADEVTIAQQQLDRTNDNHPDHDFDHEHEHR